MTLEERIQGLRLRALYRAVELGNASQVCRELGISRSLFYRWKKRFDQYGPEGLHPRRRGCRRGRPPKVEAHEEQAVLGMAVSWPTWGPRRLSAQLARSSVRVAPSTVHRLLRRVGLGTRHERLAVLEHHSARSAGLLTRACSPAPLAGPLGPYPTRRSEAAGRSGLPGLLLHRQAQGRWHA